MVRAAQARLIHWLRRLLDLPRIEKEIAILQCRVAELEALELNRRPSKPTKAKDIPRESRGIPSWRDIQNQVLKEEEKDNGVQGK